MKKIICIVMSVVLLLSTAVCVFADSPKKDSEYPVIMVAGYSSSWLKMTDENGNEKEVWGSVETEKIFKVIKDVLLPEGGIQKLSTEQMGKIIGTGVVDLFGDLAFDENGESINNISTYVSTAEECCTKNLIESGREELITEPEIQAEIANRIGGYDNLFTFHTDFRYNTTQCAKDLDAFIEDVLDYTGSDKVNIFAVSHGGQTTATYLSLYGNKKQVNNAVLTIPAIGGAALAYDIMSGKAILDEENLFRFIEHGMMWETDLDWLVQCQPFTDLDEIIDVVTPYLLEGVLGNWGSMWDFIPAPYYEEVKELLLDPVEDAGIIEKTDYVHNELMPNYGKNLRKAADEYGINISILAGTDNNAVTGLNKNSDAVITLNASTGATAAPLGQKFSDGYTAINGNNDYVSPAMNVDASTAYLPDNTWFVHGLFHGMTIKDKYTTELTMKLLLTDELEDVNTSPEYPRFRASTNKSCKVYFTFKDSLNGKIGSKNDTLVITNISEKYPMKLLAITPKGLGNISFEIPKGTKLQPGGSIEIKYSGEMKAASKTSGEVTVSYMLIGDVTPMNERTLYFTLDNGTAPEYDSANPLTLMRTYADDTDEQKSFNETLSSKWYARIIRLFLNIFKYTFKIA